MRNVFSSALVLLVALGSAIAQSDRGNINGTVSDPGGGVVPNATVTARNLDSGASSQAATTATGNYTIPQLPAGSYELSVEVPGFKKFVQTGISVQVAQTARIDVMMQLGQTNETVTVTADATLLKTESAEQSQNITAERMSELPLNFSGLGVGNVRNPYAFINLTPGASLTPNGTSFNLRVNGLPNNTESVRVEGQEANNTLQPGSPHQTQPSIEAMQEVAVQSSNYSPEFGQVGGGMFNFTTKSGSNQYHGSAYEYFVNDKLNAGVPFTDAGNGQHVRPASHKHDFGGSLGGPILIPRIYSGRNRTFFFFNFEQYIQRQTVYNGLATVPTAAMRAGDFSSVLGTKVLGTDPLGNPIYQNQIYDPTSTQIANGQTVRTPFPNNIIPARLLDPVALKIQSYIPLPTSGGNTNNFGQYWANPRDQNIPSVKVDHVINEKNKLSFFWTRYADDHFSGQDGLPVPLTATRYIPIRSWTVRLSYDYTISPTLLLHAGIGHVKYGNPDKGVAGVSDYDSVQGLGLTGASTLGFPRLAGLNVAGYGGSSLSLGPTNFNEYRTDKPSAVASLTWVRGNHTYKAGGEFRNDSYTDRNYRTGSGVYNFSANETADPYLQSTSIGGTTIGFQYASFLLGLVNNAQVAGYQDPQFRKNTLGIFVQDNWKLSPRLTVEYGMRWDYENPPQELHGRTAIFSPTTLNPSVGNLPGGTAYEGYGPGRCNCRFTSTYPYALGPRLGVAYQLTPKTVLRAGWGVTYGTTANFNFITNTQIIGVGFNSLSFTSPSFGQPGATLKNGLQYNPAILNQASYDPGIKPTPGALDAPPYWLDPNGGRPSRIQQWNIGIQREVARNIVVEAAYVGNRGVWEQANGLVNINALSAARIASFGLNVNSSTDLSLLTSTFATGRPQAAGFKLPYATFPTGQTLAQSLRPYPQFGNITTQWAPDGDSWYDSLQVKATKRYSRGLEITSAFTWQKELTLGAEVQDGTSGPINNALNRPNQKHISQYSQPLVFVLAFNYEVPKFGAGRFTRALLSGWTFNGILRYASGLPIQVPASNNSLSSVFFQSTFQNRVPGQPLFTKGLNCHCIDPNKEFVLNPAAWQDPSAGQWGTSSVFYNDYRYARRPDEQLTVGRAFRIHEQVQFRIRAEFFNVFNRTFLSNPTNTNAQAPQAVNSLGVPTGGFGYINSASLANPARTGQLVARFEF